MNKNISNYSRKVKRIYGFLWKNSSGQVQAIYEDDCNSRQHFYNVRQSFIRSRITIEDLYTTKPYRNNF